MNDGKRVIIRNKSTGDVIASGSNPLQFESNFYFDVKDVNMELLSETQRIYTCSYKGSCFWMDLQEKNETEGESKVAQPNAAWVYRDPLPGYEMIKNKIGFSAWDSGQIQIEIEEREPR